MRIDPLFSLIYVTARSLQRLCFAVFSLLRRMTAPVNIWYDYFYRLCVRRKHYFYDVIDIIDKVVIFFQIYTSIALF